MLPPPSIFASLFQFCFSYFLHKFINKRHFPFKKTPPPHQVPNPYIPLPPPHIRHPPPFLIRNLKHPLKFVFEYFPSHSKKLLLHIKFQTHTSPSHLPISATHHPF